MEVTMGHRHICCDGCQRMEFRGRRFRCMRCVNYDLCGDCYDQRVQTQAHSVDHPMQLIPEPGQDSSLQLGSGVLDLLHLSNSYTCPYCGIYGFSSKQLIKHVCDQHRLTEGYVLCPMCAIVPAAELLVIPNLAHHLLLTHIDQANQLEPETPPLRCVSTRSSRRRCQQPQPQQSSRESSAMLAIDDVAMPHDTQDRMGNDKSFKSNAEPSGSGNQTSERLLLPKWIAEQERRCRDTESSVTERHERALFTEQLLLSMLCTEELELPETMSTERETETKKSEQQLGPSKVMSLMSLPWARLSQVSQWEGKSLWSTAMNKIEVDSPQDQTAWLQRAEAGTEEEAID